MTNPSDSKPKTPAICATCGSKLGDADTRCSVCGATVRDRMPAGKKREASQVTLSLPVALVIVAVFTVLAVVLTFLATRGLGANSPAEVEATVTSTPTDTATPQPTSTSTPVYTPTPLPTIEYIVDTGDSLLAIAVRFRCFHPIHPSAERRLEQSEHPFRRAED